MKKAASIFLRANMTQRDVRLLLQWMENPAVTQYLNEDSTVTTHLRQMECSVPEPMLTYHFNRRSRFFMACTREGEAIGFVKLREQMTGTYEIVYAIGDEALWGQGYGTDAVRSALATAFLKWRAGKVIAKIYPENLRSVRSVGACGFRCAERGERLHRFEITMKEYLNR
ncbi:MAG: GNAT family N-acetyltransferase [Oscillospiraceae bacterium]